MPCHISFLVFWCISSLTTTAVSLGFCESLGHSIVNMFPSSMQPSIISLFSSTGELPLSLFSTHTDLALPSDSLIHILNDSNSSPKPFPPATLVEPPFTGEGTSGYCLDQSVLQIQSPTLSTTFIQCPSYNCSSAQETDGHLTRNHVLGLMHPWLHIQVRNMGREWSFEVGLVDQTGGCGIVRCSTFQVGHLVPFITQTCSMSLRRTSSSTLVFKNIL